MLAGIGGISRLPIEQYPDIAPTTVNIRANYPGASAETVENSVTQILEQQLTGLDGLLYFSANSTSTGSVGITATFEKGTDPDIAQVQVQNKVQHPLSRVPGVGDVNVFGAPAAMRIWLNPSRLAAFSLMPSDVIAAISAQNAEIAAGQIGGLPQSNEQMLNATVTAQSKLQIPEQFRNIVVKSDS